jgi:hypothetical protein
MATLYLPFPGRARWSVAFLDQVLLMMKAMVPV